MYDYDINRIHGGVSDEWIEKYRAFEESASINECLRENGALTHDFRPVWPGSRAVGRAFTVQCRAGDNLIIHKAITMLGKNDFLIITCDGFRESGGMFGGMMSTTAQKFGCSGLVIDGCVRDTMLMKEIGFPVWSRGVSIRRSTKLTPGKINVPIVIGGILIEPGQLIFADNDAVVRIPHGEVEAVYEKAKEREESEAARLEDIIHGDAHTFNEQFRKTLESLGLTEEE